MRYAMEPRSPMEQPMRQRVVLSAARRQVWASDQKVEDVGEWVAVWVAAGE